MHISQHGIPLPLAFVTIHALREGTKLIFRKYREDKSNKNFPLLASSE
jgi:hypothetical protein